MKKNQKHKCTIMTVRSEHKNEEMNNYYYFFRAGTMKTKLIKRLVIHNEFDKSGNFLV